jgi:hypothetical protein
MIDEQANEYGRFTIQRGRGHADLTICLDPKPHWLWRFWPPEHERPEVEYFTAQENGMIFQGSREWEPPAIACDTDYLLSCIGTEDAKALMGYCSHLIEHSTQHVTVLTETLGEAIAARNWAVVSPLADELANSARMRSFVQQAARAFFDATDGVEN